MTRFNAELAGFLNDLCDAAARETLPRFRTKIDITNKLVNDFDPVTEGDREAEKAIRNLIMDRYPDHGIIGEEFDAHKPDAEFQWIIDPIDGTRAFISGLPVWGTLIGLYHHGKPYAGVMDQPFTRERFCAIPDDDNRLVSYLTRGENIRSTNQTSDVTKLRDAILMTTSPDIFPADEVSRFAHIQKSIKLIRYGCDCYAYAMLAAGYVDIVVESGLHVYDIAALIPIIEGAGGIVTNWQGGDASQGGQILACANDAIHGEALEILRPKN